MNYMCMNHYILICTDHLCCVMWGHKHKGTQRTHGVGRKIKICGTKRAKKESLGGFGAGCQVRLPGGGAT